MQCPLHMLRNQLKNTIFQNTDLTENLQKSQTSFNLPVHVILFESCLSVWNFWSDTTSNSPRIKELRSMVSFWSFLLKVVVISFAGLRLSESD